MLKRTLDDSHPVMRLIQLIEWIGLLLITMATIIAIGQEVYVVIINARVELHDILLFFIYLEVLTMVAMYLTSGKLPVRYPIYIAIVAITRSVILEMKEMTPDQVIWLALAILLLTFAALVLRFGHARFPYERTDE